MLIALQLVPYLLLILVVLGLLAFSGSHEGLKLYRRGLTFGLALSPLGFVLPYLAFMGIVAVCHGTWPTDGIPVVGPLARILVPALLMIGPVVGPPLVIFFVARRCRKTP